MHLLPMYSHLTLKDQLEVFKDTPIGKKKFVAATNVAESSITIPGIVYVIDCMYFKCNYFDYRK